MSVGRIEVNGHELTAFDLPPEPSDTYHVWVDGIGEIVVEKGKPPKEKDVPAMYMRKLVPELCEQNAELHRENAKLRELCEDMHAALQAFCDAQDVHGDNCPLWVERTDDCELRGIERRMRALGVEVE